MAEIRRRDDLPARERAVSVALDQLNHICYGTTHSWAYPVDFLDFLADEGYTVVSVADLDLVMNHAGNPTKVADYPAASDRVQAAIEAGRRQ
ncbi:hypothetical protein [Nonomuraea sp. NPDC049709]|uniref:hypothetical protein n=1 Tax=Nonomuraea sp. NPDC049709 TaxID=3154736 RepID=UPI003443981A